MTYYCQHCYPLRALIQRAAKAGNMGTAIRVEEVLKKNEVDQKSLIEDINDEKSVEVCSMGLKKL